MGVAFGSWMIPTIWNVRPAFNQTTRRRDFVQRILRPMDVPDELSWKSHQVPFHVMGQTLGPAVHPVGHLG